MKALLIFITAFALPILGSGAETPAQSFDSAAKAYDAGDFVGASTHYETLVRDGIVSAEVFYNLGNARFKQGRVGEAVLNYRRAWMVQPRDPDIRANLDYALQQAGAAAPETSLLTLLARRLSGREWRAIAVAAYWVCAIALGAILLFPSRRSGAIKAACCAGALLVVASGGAFAWRSLQTRPELVIVGSPQRALFAPIENSTPHFSIPTGAIVRMVESSGPWLKIEYGNDAGWIRRKDCEPVYPLDATSTAETHG